MAARQLSPVHPMPLHARVSQPTIISFPELIGEFQMALSTLTGKFRSPRGWSTCVAEDQLTLMRCQSAALRFRHACGYVSSIKITDIKDAGSPFCAQVILRLPLRYGIPHSRPKTEGYTVGLTLSPPAIASPSLRNRFGLECPCAAWCPSRRGIATLIGLLDGPPKRRPSGCCYPPKPFLRVGWRCLSMTFTARLEYF